MRLIDGLNNTEHRFKLLEQLQCSDGRTSLENCIQLVQQLEMITDFSRISSSRLDENIHSVAQSDRNRSRNQGEKTKNLCRYCGYSHERGRCPAFGKTCNLCTKRNHFAKVCLKTNAKEKEDSTNYIGKENMLEDEEHGYNIYIPYAILRRGDRNTRCVRF